MLGGDIGGLVLTAMVAAFLDSFVGARLIHRATRPALESLVGVLLMVVAVALGSGLV